MQYITMKKGQAGMNGLFKMGFGAAVIFLILAAVMATDVVTNDGNATYALEQVRTAILVIVGFFSVIAILTVARVLKF